MAENALQAVRRPTDDYFSSWYYQVSTTKLGSTFGIQRVFLAPLSDLAHSSQHSDIFVASNHAAWDPERTRKPRKKYGKLHKSSKENLNEMLVKHRSEVTEILDEETHEWRLEMEEQEDQKRIKIKMENAAVYGLNGVALRPQEREIRAGSMPTLVRSPGRPPPMGTFSLGVPRGAESPRTPKR